MAPELLILSSPSSPLTSEVEVNPAKVIVSIPLPPYTEVFAWLSVAVIASLPEFPLMKALAAPV